MLVIGAKGFAKEVLNMLLLKKELDNLVFFDDVNLDDPDLLYNQFPIIRRLEEAESYFKHIDNRFTLGVGFPEIRYQLYKKFIDLGAVPYTLISPNSDLGDFDVNIGTGVTIGYHCAISNSVNIGKGSLINAKTIIGHDSSIGEFCEICPSVNLAGHVEVGDFSFVGTGVIVYPEVKIGKNVTITAGSVIRKNVPDNAMVHGIDGKIIRIKKENLSISSLKTF